MATSDRWPVGQASNPKNAIQQQDVLHHRAVRTRGCFSRKTIAENVAMANMVNTREFFTRPANDDLTGEKYVKLLNIKAPSARTRVVNLSGGY